MNETNSSNFPDGKTNIGATDIGDDELAEIATLLNLHRAINMGMYKENYLKRRVAIRIRIGNCRDAAEYCQLLRSSERELDLLVKGLTIHVSQFYRNPTLFETLRRDVFPSLYATAEASGCEQLRIWSFGCAGGEEPYSLAILLREYFPREIRNVATIITGSDIDAGSIAVARQGEYSEDRLRDLPPRLKELYFREHNGRFRLTSTIQKMVTYCIADMSDPASYQPADIILCRNALIYFTRSDQEKILSAMADILPRRGILILGKSETLVGTARQQFETICMEERIYRKK